MQKTKKFIALALIALLALSAAACTATNNQSTTADDVQQEETSAVKTGVVTDASMHNLTIEAEDGSTYSFITDDDTEIIDGRGNLGDTVSVEFDGEYQEYMLAKKIVLIEEGQ